MENAVLSNTLVDPASPNSPTLAADPARCRQPQLMTWSGRTLSGLYVLFMLGASVTPKLLRMPIVDETMTQLGWPAGSGFLIGLLELTCVLLYLIPRTAIFGAVLMMGVLGGAIATHIGARHPLFSHVLFPIYVGLFMWGGLWLRSPGLRALFPYIRR